MRWAIVSADPVSAVAAWAVPIVRAHPQDRPDTHAIDTRDTDPVTGRLLLMGMVALNPDSLGDPVGTLSGHTVDRIDAGLRAMFDL